MDLEKTQHESFRRGRPLSVRYFRYKAEKTNLEAQDNGQGEGSSSAMADPKILGNQASKNESAPEPRHNGEGELTRDIGILRHRTTEDETALERGTRRGSAPWPKNLPDPTVQTYITGTFDPDKKEPSTLIVFRVTLLGKDRLSKLRFGLDFRSPRTAQRVDDLLIVDYAPVDQISKNLRDELDNTRVLLSPSTTTIIWDLWTMRKSNDAISPDNHDFAVLLKRKSQGQLMAKLSLETKTQQYWLTTYKYRRSFEITFDPGRKPLGIPRNLNPRYLGKVDLKLLVNRPLGSEVLPEPKAAPQEPEVAAAPPEPGATPQEPEVAVAPEPEVAAPPESGAAPQEPEVALAPEPEVAAPPEPGAAPQEPKVAAAPPEPGAAPQEPEVAAAPEPEAVAPPEPEAASQEPEACVAMAVRQGAHASGKRALVQYDYEKAEDNEIELKEGEYVTNIEMLDEDWWMGENVHGETGLFPSNYVELAPDPEAPRERSEERVQIRRTGERSGMAYNEDITIDRKEGPHGDQSSFRSGISKSSINNPNLLETVEDPIRRLILPELTAFKREQISASNRCKFDRDTEASDTSGSSVSREKTTRRTSKHESAPKMKPSVAIHRDSNEAGEPLSKRPRHRERRRKDADFDSASEWSYSRRESGDRLSVDESRSHHKKGKSHRVGRRVPEPQEPEVPAAPEPEAATPLSLAQLVAALETVALARWPIQRLEDPALHLAAPPLVLDEECCSSLWHRSNRCVRGDYITPVRKYVVIGVFYKDIAFPREKLVDLSDYDDSDNGGGGGDADNESDVSLIPHTGYNNDVSRRLHEEVASLRGVRRFLSLKELCGFSIYKCDPALNTHIRVPPDSETRRIFQQLYLSYCDSEDGMSNWINFIHQNLNGGRGEPGAGQYSIELVLGWSVLRIAIIALTPVILSLIIGIYYQQVHHDVATAWIISTYIVAAGAIVVGVLGVATSLGHV